MAVFVAKFVALERFVGPLSFINTQPSLNVDSMANFHAKKADFRSITATNAVADNEAGFMSGYYSMELCFDAGTALIIVESRSCQMFLLLTLANTIRLHLDPERKRNSCLPCLGHRWSVWL